MGLEISQNQSEGIIQKEGIKNILQEGEEVLEEIEEEVSWSSQKQEGGAEEEGDTGEELENR